ncbi:hypothetical protein [Pseudomonas phage LKA1]|uniref:Uncharacterized protein n=1 Tax=Pseudomonas phage LKA1 TaxID=386793 RepID=Q0E5Z2_9CAUD|nr:hypothetical protein AV952_gp22 [Pseudomonas phage LKA1]CAK24990.1 hypothetical protein [Pseudomonas phage LKA1]
MSNRDQPIHMLRYWINDKGIERLSEYYPKLTKNDAEIRAALEHRALAERALLSRVDELMGLAGDEDDYE